jgi:ribosomal protein S18 acetylase RimI-like enzyme
MTSDHPAVLGLRFRHVRGEGDADAVCELRVGCAERDQVDPLSASESLPGRQEYREALARIVAAGQQHMRLVAEVDGQMVGYTLIESWSEDDGRWVYLILGWVLPAWRGRGIGTAMLHWGERTALRLAATDHPGERCEFAGNASSTEVEATALLLHEGYAAGYTVLEMGLDFSALPPVHPLPAGIEVRPARSEHIPLMADSIHESYRNEYAGNRFHETSTVEDTVARLSGSRHDPALWQVAWDGDRVVGNVLPLVERGRATMYDISVRPHYRRRELARALLTRALWDLRGRGLEVIRVNTIAEFQTRAKDLYTSVGFRLLKEFPRYRKSPY